MKNQKTIITISTLALILAVLAISGFAHAQTYQTVTNFTGSADQTTDYFTIPSSEWRITWSYTPSSVGGDYAGFSVFAYPKGETALYTTSIYQTGANQTSGVTYVHEGPNDYYLKIASANIDSYTITIEAQPAATATDTPTPTPTIPEYSVTATFFVLVAIGLSSIVLMKKRQTKAL